MYKRQVLILCSEAIDPMTLVRCYPIGIITMIDGGEFDEKIIAIPFNDPNYNSYTDISELPIHLSNEMSYFFETYKHLEDKETAVLKVEGREVAKSVIEENIHAYKLKFKK